MLLRLDSDKAYPVYGDDSTIVEDAPTSGKFYFRAEKDGNHVLWGNYKGNLTGSEFLRNERTLYGLKFVPRERDPETGDNLLYENSAFTLYPEAEVNETMGLIAHPSRKIMLGADVYVHVSTIPKEEEEPKFKVHLRRGSAVEVQWVDLD